MGLDSYNLSKANLRVENSDVAVGNPVPVDIVDATGITISASIDSEFVDDSAFTVGTSSGMAAGGVFTSDTIDSGDFGAFKINANRELATTVENAVTVSATNLDIRDLTSASDSVEVLQATGTNLHAVLDANNGVDIGDVDVTSIVSGVGATNLGKAEDEVHASGDVGVMALAVRQDAEATMAADGDYTPLQTDADGKLKTLINTQYDEDDPHSDGDSGIMALAVRNDVLASLGDTDGDYVPLQTDADGAIWNHKYKAGSIVDSGNSTTTPLGGSATFTGTGVDLLGYSAVCVTLFADVDSGTDGMQFQFSTDNSNWDDSYGFTMDVSSSTARRFQFPVTARYFRVVYTNGGSGQGAFRVQTILHTENQLTSIHVLEDDMSPDRSAQVVKSVLFAQKAGAGDFTAINSTNGGNLKISVQEISDGLDIGAGNAGSETARVSISTDDVNMSAIKNAVEIMDDWDETNRAAVNIVSGQAGITANAGAVGASTPRVTLASDDPGVASLSNIEAGFAAENAALASGVLLQGDDGTNRKNINVDATTGDVQVDVTNTVTVTESSPITGFATSALQLADGHNVTVDNGAAGSAVNIQDGGNTITVDGTVTANAGTGNFNVNLQDGAGTDLTSTLVGADQSLDVNLTQSVALDVSAATVTVDLGANNDVTVTSGAITETNSTAMLADTAIMSEWDNTASDGASVSGDVAHDGIDAGEPVKIGGKAIDYEPDAEDAQGATDVAANDRANAAVNLKGEQIEGVNSLYHLFDGSFPNTGLDGRYDDSPTASTSESVECWNYRYCTIGFDLDSTLSPTDITFQVEVSADGTNWFELTNGATGQWIYDDTSCATEISEAYSFPICARLVRVVVTATGSDATNYFDVDNSFIYLRN